jgi:DNA polymerase-3 subunit chi
MGGSAQKVAEFIELRSPEDKVPQICARATHHFELGQTVVIHTDDPAEAEDIDAQLWTFRQNSFVPHVRRAEAEEPLLEPVVIFSGEPAGLEADVLVVGSAGPAPQWAAAFTHIYDFAQIYDEALRDAARRRFAAYKEAGYRMRFIKPEGPG